MVAALTLVTLHFMSLLITSQPVQAAAAAKEYIQLNSGITLADNLVALKGRIVTVTLSSGHSMTGTVKEVKDNLLHLEKISQKDFYDALIRVDLVSAIETRVR